MAMISNFLFNFSSCCVIASFFFVFFFLTKLLTFTFLISTAVRAVLVAKLLILDISSLTLFILALRVVWVA